MVGPSTLEVLGRVGWGGDMLARGEGTALGALGGDGGPQV